MPPSRSIAEKPIAEVLGVSEVPVWKAVMIAEVSIARRKAQARQKIAPVANRATFATAQRLGEGQQDVLIGEMYFDHGGIGTFAIKNAPMAKNTATANAQMLCLSCSPLRYTRPVPNRPETTDAITYKPSRFWITYSARFSWPGRRDRIAVPIADRSRSRLRALFSSSRKFAYLRDQRHFRLRDRPPQS